MSVKARRIKQNLRATRDSTLLTDEQRDEVLAGWQLMWDTAANHEASVASGATYYADCYGHPHRVEGRKPILSNGGAWRG